MHEPRQLLADQFPTCPQRSKLVKYQRNGTQIAVFRCGEQTAPAANTDVTPEICTECPVRSKILESASAMRAVKTPFEQIHKIRSRRADNATDGWEPCKKREVVSIMACCGKTHETKLCKSGESEHFGQEVTPVICQSCPVRRL